MNKKEIRWFPMRVTYNRELKLKERLELLNIETFLPLKQQFVVYGGRKRLEMIPAVHNLLFVHSSREVLTNLKLTEEEFSPLRYMMSRPIDKTLNREILTINDREMENFIRVASLTDDRVMFLDYQKVAEKVGKRVVITDGDFAGIEGVVLRVDKNRRVVIKLEGVAAVALAFVPSAYLKFVGDGV